MKKSEAKAYLKTIDPETVEFITDYKNAIQATTDPEKAGWLNSDYHIMAVGEGYVDSIEEFDKIYNALCVLDKKK